MSGRDPDDASLLRRMARWAWERDEVDPGTTTETLLYTVAMYGVTLLLITLAGVGLAAFGHRSTAFALLLFGISFTAFIGVVNIGWELLQLRGTWHRAAGPSAAGPQRELAPDIRVAQDTKIGFLVTLVGLVVLYVAFELARWLSGVV